MKKLLSITAVALMAVTFTSCEKEYTCDCSYTVLGITSTTSQTETLKKKDAEDWCDEYNANFQSIGGSCELK